MTHATSLTTETSFQPCHATGQLLSCTLFFLSLNLIKLVKGSRKPTVTSAFIAFWWDQWLQSPSITDRSPRTGRRRTRCNPGRRARCPGPSRRASSWCSTGPDPGAARVAAPRPGCTAAENTHEGSELRRRTHSTQTVVILTQGLYLFNKGWKAGGLRGTAADDQQGRVSLLRASLQGDLSGPTGNLICFITAEGGRSPAFLKPSHRASKKYYDLRLILER